jgi:Protein of unknown function (DUF3306)
MTGKDDAPFLSRWARRKQEARQARNAGVLPDEPSLEAVELTVASSVEGREAEQPFDPASLPKIEDLTLESDITVFLRKGVPEELKRLALRQVWSLDPQIRDFVEVAENQYDWNAVGGVPGFGPLAEGTDIQALLAQATGQLNQVLPDEPEAALTAAVPRREHQDPSTAAPRQDDHVAVATDFAAEDEAWSGASETQTSVADQPTAPRRRHGGALPG